MSLYGYMWTDDQPVLLPLQAFASSIPSTRHQNFPKQCTVKITELSKVTTEEKLATEFGQVSPTACVLGVKINNGGKAFNWGYINYSCSSDAQKAVQCYNGKRIDGHRIRVKMRDSYPHSETPYGRSSRRSQASPSRSPRSPRSPRYAQNSRPDSSLTGLQSTPDCCTIRVAMYRGSLRTYDLEKLFEEFETSKKSCSPLVFKVTPNLAYINFARPKDARRACAMGGREFKDVQLRVNMYTKGNNRHSEFMASVHKHRYKTTVTVAYDSFLVKLILSRIDRFREQFDSLVTIKKVQSGKGIILTGDSERVKAAEEFITELADKLNRKLKEESFFVQCQYVPVLGKQDISKTFSDIQKQFSVKLCVAYGDNSSVPVNNFAHLASSKLSTKSGEPTQTSSLKTFLTTPKYHTTEDQWSWETDDGSFIPYSSDACAKLNEQFKLSPGSSFQCELLTQVGTLKYTIDLQTMTQMNNATRRIRSIRRHQGIIEWCYRNDKGRLVPFSSTGSEKIEKIKDSTEPTILVIDGTIYVFDFSKMKRIDEKTKQECTIVRTVIPKPTYGPCVCISVHGLPEDIPDAIKCLQRAIENEGINKTEISLPSEEGIEDIGSTLLKTAREYFVSAEIVDDKLQLKGVNGYVENVHIKIMGDLHTHEKQMIFKSKERALTQMDELPEHWEPQTKKIELKSVSPGSSEWNHVTSCINKNGNIQLQVPLNVTKIERIQNQWQWERYCFAKKRMFEKNEGEVNEMELFHGTRNIPPEKIFRSEQGFDFRYASSYGMWGTGTYFAVNASYSASYAHQNGSTKQFILAKVLTGETCRCPPNNSLKKPPVKTQKATNFYSHEYSPQYSSPGYSFIQIGMMVSRTPSATPSADSSTKDDFEDELYDSVSGNTGNSDIFVIYDHEKAYPAYLITFQ